MNNRRMNPRYFTVLVTLSLTAGFLDGCAASNRNTPAEYQTIGKDPRRDVDKARKESDKAVELIHQGKYDEAEKTLKAALAADVTFGPAHNNLGDVYYHQHKYYLAAWEYQYAIKLMPNQPEPRNNLGLVFEQVGKLDEAIDNYAKAKEMAPDEPQFIGNLARARVRRGDRGAEIQDLLQQVVLKDTRPQWVQWAKEQSALLGRNTSR
jgi:Flp pilus assembly protein TadD